MSLRDQNFRLDPVRSRPAASPAVDGHRPLALALAVAACFAAAPLRAQPAGAQVIQGAAAFQQNGNNLTITTQNGVGTAHSAINWQSFNVPAGSTTRFNQPTAQSTSINRVLGNDPSSIFGNLSSNGRLVLVNPAGIAVGAGAVVDTAGFTASTLRMSDADALAGRMRFGDGGIAGGISVGGQIVARGGDVVLIAPNVDNASTAVIQSTGGAAVLAAGRKVEVTGRGLEGINFEVQAPEDKAVNLGTIKGDAVGIFAGTLRHSGLASAQSATVEGGKVVLRGLASAQVDGRVTAQAANAAGTKGGQIHVTANAVNLGSTAVLDASGEAGGGEVLVGGGWKGNDARVANAQQVTADAGSVIRADATGKGDGGTVVLWSRDTTRTAATLSARGGARGGNGGRVETSGSLLLRTGVPDTSAPQGLMGQWLLDPDFVLIQGGDSGGYDGSDVTKIYQCEIDGNGNIIIEARHAVLAVGDFGSKGLEPTGTLTISTRNDVAPTTVPTPFADFSRGIDLTAAGQINHESSNAGHITIQAGTHWIGGTTVPTVTGIALRLPSIDASNWQESAVGSDVVLRSAGDLSVGHISTRQYGTVAGTGGNVTIEAKFGHVEVGAIDTTVDNRTNSYMNGEYVTAWNDPTAKAGDIAIDGKTVRLTGNLTADGVVDASRGSAPGNITVVSGWNCGIECTNVPTLMIGHAEMGMPAAAGIPMTDEGDERGIELDINARGGLKGRYAEPARGGKVQLEAKAGNIVLESGYSLSVDVSGQVNDVSGSGVLGIGGGEILVKATQGRIEGPEGASLELRANGGDSASENGDGIPAGRSGGDGGTVQVSAATGISLAALTAYADGGAGGGLTSSFGVPASESPAPPPPMPQAGNGGQGGEVTVSTDTGNIGVSLLNLSAAGGAGGNLAYSDIEGTPGLGGNGGSITLKALQLWFTSSNVGVLTAGAGESSIGSALGGSINLEATSAAGQIRLDDSVFLLDTSLNAELYTGNLSLRAGSGGIQIGSPASIFTGSLHLDSPVGMQNTLGSVSITGLHEISQVYGPVTGAGASLTLESIAGHLRLGGGDSQALTVSGNINIGGPFGMPLLGEMIVADTVQSNTGKITLRTNMLSLASGAASEKLVANSPAGSVDIFSDRVIRFSSATHADDPDTAGCDCNSELVLNSDELKRMDTPMLRVSNAADASETGVVFGASSRAPMPTAAAGPGPAPAPTYVSFNSSDSLAPGKTVSIKTNGIVDQIDPFSVDKMHITAGQVNLPLDNLFGDNTATGTGRFSADIKGFGADPYEGQARLVLGVGSQGTLLIAPVDTGGGGFNSDSRGVYAVSNLYSGEGGMVPSVWIGQPTGSDSSFSPATLEIGQPGITSGEITLRAQNVYNTLTGFSGTIKTVGTANGQAAGNAVGAGDVSITIETAGNMGQPEGNGYLNLSPAAGTKIRLRADEANIRPGTVAAIFLPGASEVKTSTFDASVGSSDGGFYLGSPGAIKVDSNFSPAHGTVELYAGGGGVNVASGASVGSLSGLETVRLEGRSISVGGGGSVLAHGMVDMFANGTTNGDILLASTALVSSGHDVLMEAAGAIVGSSYSATDNAQVRGHRILLNAGGNVQAHVNPTTHFVSDAPEFGTLMVNSTNGTAADVVVTNTSGQANIAAIRAANGTVRVRAAAIETLAVIGDLPAELADEGVTDLIGGITAKSVSISTPGGNLHLGRNVTATDASGGGISLSAGDVIRVGHFDRYDRTVHVKSEANLSLYAQSIYLCHTALACHYTGSYSMPTGTAPVPTTAEGATVRLYARGALDATAVSDETIEINATNTGGVGAAAQGNMSLNSPTINFVGGSGPNQFALATSPNLTFTNGGGGTPNVTYTPGTGANSFAQSGATAPTLGGGGTTTPPPPATTPPATTPPPPATTPPPPSQGGGTSPPDNGGGTTPPPDNGGGTVPPPAPSPTGSPVVDRIIEILPSVTVGDAQKIVNETDSVLTTFVTKLLAEESRQAEENEKKRGKQDDLALLTDQQCKP